MLPSIPPSFIPLSSFVSTITCHNRTNLRDVWRRSDIPATTWPHRSTWHLRGLGLKVAARRRLNATPEISSGGMRKVFARQKGELNKRLGKHTHSRETHVTGGAARHGHEITSCWQAGESRPKTHVDARQNIMASASFTASGGRRKCRTDYFQRPPRNVTFTARATRTPPSTPTSPHPPPFWSQEDNTRPQHNVTTICHHNKHFNA